MILESLNQVKDGNNYKSIHVITLEAGKPPIIMGRGHEADIRINDISVSRVHGTITLLPGDKIMLKDLGSKFGTLVLIQNKFIVPNKKTCIQIGRSYMEIMPISMNNLQIYRDEQKRLEKSQSMKE